MCVFCSFPPYALQINKISKSIKYCGENNFPEAVRTVLAREVLESLNHSISWAFKAAGGQLYIGLLVNVLLMYYPRPKELEQQPLQGRLHWEPRC